MSMITVGCNANPSIKKKHVLISVPVASDEEEEISVPVKISSTTDFTSHSGVLRTPKLGNP